MQIISQCRVCKNKHLKKFLNLGNHPFANALLKAPGSNEKTYPLSMSWCPDCKLVQLNETPEPKEIFSEYFWVTGTSLAAKVWAEEFCNEVLSRSVTANRFVLEIASNDGTFLIPFKNRNFEVLGIDPAKNIALIANQNGISTHCEFFTSSYAQSLIKEKGHAGVIIIRNALPHVFDTCDVMDGLSQCLDESGILVIEVQYAKLILDGFQYDTIYHEHLCYFSLYTLKKLIELYGLKIFDIIESPLSGGSITVFVAKKPKTISPNVVKYIENEEKTGVNNFESWAKFSKNTFEHCHKLKNLVFSQIYQKKRIVGYGASARSSTLLNFCKLDSRFIEVIADKNPLKHRYYTAGTHILIESPDYVMSRNPDTVFVLAWNFAGEIITFVREKYQFKGSFLLPLPGDPVIIN